MDVSIIILNYNSAYQTKYCLKSILRVLPQCSVELIVVDNASRESIEPIEQILNNSPVPARLIKAEKNAGYAAGNNLGIKNAQGRYILITNPDIVFRAHVIDRLADYLDLHPKAALAAPALQNPDGTDQTSCFRFYSWYIPLYRRTVLGRLPGPAKKVRHFEMADVKFQGPTNVDWIMGSCFLVRREAIVQVGPLDEQFFLYFEDTDWCRRFHQGGWEVVYLPDVFNIHYYHRASAEKSGLGVLFSKMTRIHIKSAIKYFLKYGFKNP